MGTKSRQLQQSVENLASALVALAKERAGANNVDGNQLFKAILNADIAPYGLKALSDMMAQSRNPVALLNDAVKWIDWVRRDKDFDLPQTLVPFRTNLRSLLYSASKNKKLADALEGNRRGFGGGKDSLDRLIDQCVQGFTVFVDWRDELTLNWGPLNPAMRGDICVACSAAHLINESNNAGTVASAIESTLGTRQRTYQPGKERLLVEVIPVRDGTLLMTGEHVMALTGDATSHGGSLTGRSLDESAERSANYVSNAMRRRLNRHSDPEGEATLHCAPDGHYVALLSLNDPTSFGQVGGLHAVAAIVERGKVRTYDALKGEAGVHLNSVWAIYRVA